MWVFSCTILLVCKPIESLNEKKVACAFPEDEEGKDAGKEMQGEIYTSCLDLLSQTQTSSQGLQIFLYCLILLGVFCGFPDFH